MWVAFPILQGQQPKKPTRCYFQLSKNIWCPQFDVHKGPLSLSPLSKKARHSVLFTRIRGEFFTVHFTSRFNQPFIPFVSLYLTLEHIFNLKKKKVSEPWIKHSMLESQLNVLLLSYSAYDAIVFNALACQDRGLVPISGSGGIFLNQCGSGSRRYKNRHQTIF